MNVGTKKRITIYTLVAALAATTLAGANDILQQLDVAKSDASTELVSSLVNANVDYYRVRNAFKAATPAARAAMTEQVLVWAKAYVASPQFAKDYAAYREQAKPEAEEANGSVDDELAQQRAEQKAALEEMKKSIAQMPAEYRAQAEEAYKAAVAAMKETDTAEMRNLQRQGIAAERSGKANEAKEDLARWEKEYPANPRVLVKQRLTQFLAETANVDYGAQLVNKNSKMRFANAAYESKSSNWKLAYRAGKETTEKARAFAQSWLTELK
ncbi:MAG TPA: hypothetical protein VF911_22070 [Thermoanaerobaculia bacterium]|jgi:hypothetical protein